MSRAAGDGDAQVQDALARRDDVAIRAGALEDERGIHRPGDLADVRRRRRRPDLLVRVRDEDEALERQATELTHQGLDRVQPRQQPRFHVSDTGSPGDAVGDGERAIGGGARIEDGVEVPDQQDPRRTGSTVEGRDDRVPEATGRVAAALDVRAKSGEEVGRPAADFVDALGGIAAAVDVDQALEVPEVVRQVGGHRVAQCVELGRLRAGGRGIHAGSLALADRSHRSPGPASATVCACYPARTVRLIETRLLEGPNVYRLEPVMKLEVAIGRRRTWYGQRDPGRHALVHLGAAVLPRDWPDSIVAVVAWIRRLRADHGEGRGGVAVHRSSDPGHWIVTFPWIGAERAQTLTEAALALAARDVSPSRTARLTGNQDRLLTRWTERIREARMSAPSWIRDPDRRVPVVSISGTNGKSTVTRLITHILVRSGRHVGTTTSDGVLVDERLIEPGDWTGPSGAQQILVRRDIDVAVLETARGGIVLRGVGYESNEVSILTNVTSDHLDLQGIHTLPELAEVKATIARITKRGRVGRAQR